MKFKKIAALLLAAVMASSLAACNSKDVGWIAKTSDGEEIPSGVYIAGMVNAYTAAESKVEDKEKKVLGQTVDGKPAEQWIAEESDKAFARYVGVTEKAKAQGLSISPDEKSFLQQQVQYQWQYLGSIYQQNGVSLESLTKTLESSYKESMLFNAKYGKDGTEPIPDDTLLKEFQTNFYKTIYVTMSLTDENAELKDEAGQKLINDKANEILAKATAEGANYKDIILEYEKEQAASKGEDPATVHTHDESSHVSFINKKSESYKADFLAEVEAMKTGETKVLTSGNVIYILQKLANDVPSDMEAHRNELMQTLKGDEFKAEMEALAAETKIEYNPKAKKLYTPSKIKIDIKDSKASAK
ncbi:MAG: hypothetical protein RSB36_00850 [Hydrogenoanaerobacterium sp.]